MTSDAYKTDERVTLILKRVYLITNSLMPKHLAKIRDTHYVKKKRGVSV